MASPVIFFLSTGRCGTQWLTAGLRELYPEVWAEHEPLGPLYHPRRYFRRYRHPQAILEVPEVCEHLNALDAARRPYVETGWPSFPVLPHLAERLDGRLRVVHLTRHPVPTALSHLAHSSYADSPRADAYTRLATLGPGDPGVFQPHYSERWAQLSPYEKCLFWWTEVNLYGLELSQRMPQIPWLRMRAEEMLSGTREPLEQLLQFAGLDWREGWLAHAHRTVDRWHHHTDQEVDPLQVHDHPVTVEVAEQLGYDLASLDLRALERRYVGQPDPGLDRVGRFA